MSDNKKVLLSMSGGIDSTVAAILLLREGYSVVGVTYRTWDSVSEGCFEREKGCCTINAILEAKRMAEKMGFPHHFLDIRKEFKDSVVRNFIDEYIAGRTPNPCVVCNAKIKWHEVAKLADSLDCKYIATGHYAQIEHKDGHYYLKKGVDTAKDQTYFLWQLPQSLLHRTVFPLGQLTKPEVRRIALEAGFEKLSKKPESQEICFVSNNDYREFLEQEAENYSDICRQGNFVDPKGNILGQHSGYPNYTVGQRKGLRIALGRPMFVADIRPATNEVVLADREDLQSSRLYAKDTIFVDRSSLYDGIEVEARIRYKSPAVGAKLYFDDSSVRVDFDVPVWAIAPGQSVVFYKNDLILGGGIIVGRT